MAINFPGPYELRIHYATTVSSVTLSHVLRLNFRVDVDPPPGADFDTIDVLLKNNVTNTLDLVTDALVALIQPLFSAAGTAINYAECWRYDPGTFEASFISTYDISEAGTNVGSNNAAQQSIYTFRTQEGGIMKFVLMETTATSLQPTSYAGLGADHKALVDSILENTAPFLARDTSYPIAFRFHFPGQNEVLFKKRFRQVS